MRPIARQVGAGCLLLGAAMLGGCTPTSHTIGSYDGGPDAEIGGPGPVDINPRKVDILFVVDNTGSMETEQASLRANLPRMMRALATGDRDGDPSTTDDTFPPITDIHVGVVTTDLGTAGTPLQTCMIQPHGEDGVLRTRSADPACGDELAPFAAFTSTTDLDAALEHVSCLMQAGTNGCGFEQQLEAALKALTPESSPVRFWNETRGNGDTENAGFLRDDSVVVVIVVTDEEDCSFADASLVDGTNPSVDGTNINLRCVLFPQLLHPASRYVSGLRALRPGRPDAVLFGAIAGIPTDLVPAGGEAPNFTAILNDERLQQRQDPENPNNVIPSCEDPTRGRADPPRRIIQVAQGFGSSGFLASICQDDYSSVMDPIIARLASLSAE